MSTSRVVFTSPGSLKVGRIIEAINKPTALDFVTIQTRNAAVDKQLSDKYM